MKEERLVKTNLNGKAESVDQKTGGSLNDVIHKCGLISDFFLRSGQFLTQRGLPGLRLIFFVSSGFVLILRLGCVPTVCSADRNGSFYGNGYFNDVTNLGRHQCF
jgi:hypothetical protein